MTYVTYVTYRCVNKPKVVRLEVQAVFVSKTRKPTRAFSGMSKAVPQHLQSNDH